MRVNYNGQKVGQECQKPLDYAVPTWVLGHDSGVP